MSLLRGQGDVSPQVPMPTDRVDDASTISTSSAEVVVWSFLSAGAWAAASGEAAGTICTSKLTFTGVLNSINSAVGSFNDTSLSLGATTRFDALVAVPEAVFSEMAFLSPTDQKARITPFLPTNGNYAIDHRRGQLWGIAKATVADDTATYKYMAPVAGSGGPTSNVNIDQLQGTEVNLDDAAFAVGTDAVLPTGFLADETTPDSVDEGDTGIARMTLNRRQITASETADDAAPETGTKPSAVGFLADETASDSVDEGDIGFARMTLDRRQIVAGQILDDAAFGVGTEYANATGFLADETASDSVDEGDIGIARMTLTRKVITASEFQEDTAHTTADYGSQVLTVYKTTAAQQAGTDGDYAPLLTNSTGHLHTADGFAPQAEDNTNGVIATQNKPLAVTTYAWSVDRSTALEASSVTKASAGVIRSMAGRIDSSQVTGTYYIQVLNASSLPADGAVTTLSAPLKIQHTAGTDSNFEMDFTQNGIYASTGLVWCLSTSEFTKTLSGAYVSASVLYI